MATTMTRLLLLMATICFGGRCRTILAFSPFSTTTRVSFHLPTTMEQNQQQKLHLPVNHHHLTNQKHSHKRHCKKYSPLLTALFASRTTDQVTATASSLTSSSSSSSSKTPNYMSSTFADDIESSLPLPPTFVLPQSVASSAASAATETLPLQYLALAGAVTTFFADILMHPMDSIKTYQQQDIGLHVSLVQAATHLWNTGGLYHGFLTYAVSDCIAGALKFAVWESWKATRQQQQQQQQSYYYQYDSTSIDDSKNSKSGNNHILDLATGAALAFVVSSVVLVPGEYIKNQLQVSHYHGFWEAVSAIYQTAGLSGFYTGYQGVLFRDVPYTMLELSLYELFKKYFVNQQLMQQQQQEEEEIDNYSIDHEGTTNTVMMQQEWMAAAITGAITAFFTTPLDTIKTTLMIQEYHDEEYYYHYHDNFDLSFLDCLFQILDQHGVAGLFAGVWARMAWVVPFTVIYLPTYDWLKRQLAAVLLYKQQQQQQELEQ